MGIFNKGSDKSEDENNQLKLRMAGCFDFRHKEYHIMSGGGLARLGKKMMRSRSNPDISPSKKSATNANKVTSPSQSPPGKSSPGGTTHRRRFVRVVRSESSSDDDYHNPHVKRKTSDSTPPKKIDFEALNRRYFSDSDSDSSDSQTKKDFARAHSEERVTSPVIQAGRGPLRKGQSLDVEIPRRAHFKEEVNVIGIDKKGKQVYTSSERIQFDHLEVCDIRGETDQDMCPVSPVSDDDVLESISETPELAKSPPRLEGMDTANVELETESTEENPVVKMQVVSGNSIDSESDKENAPQKASPVATSAESESTSEPERETQSESEIRPRASSFDQKMKALRMFGFLFRSGSETRFGSTKGSPKNSPNQLRRQHRYRRILRDSDHGDEYYNPHVVRRSSSSRLSRSVGNISEFPRPILRKHASLDLPDPPDKHAHFQQNVEVVEFHKKDKCVDFAPSEHVQVDQLKSDSETDSIDEITEDVFSMHCENTDPGVSSDGSTEDVSIVGTDGGP